MVRASVASSAVAAKEPVEQARQLVRSDGRTLIDHSDAHLLTRLLGDLHPHRGASGRIASGVANQIRQGPAHKRHIDVARGVADDLHGDLDIFEGGFVIFDDGGGNGGQAGRGVAPRLGAPVRMGQEQHVMDDACEPPQLFQV